MMRRGCERLKVELGGGGMRGQQDDRVFVSEHVNKVFGNYRLKGYS